MGGCKLSPLSPPTGVPALLQPRVLYLCLSIMRKLRGSRGMYEGHFLHWKPPWLELMQAGLGAVPGRKGAGQGGTRR